MTWEASGSGRDRVSLIPPASGSVCGVRVSWAAAPESHPLLSVFCSFLRGVTTEGEGHGARDPSVLIPITAGASTTT